MRRWLIRLLILAVIIAAIWILKVTVFKPEPIPVRVQPVARGLVEATVTNSRAGTVKARHRAKLSPEVGGQIIEIPFREGDRVAKGDVVLRLDASSQQAQLGLTRRELEAALAERERACLAADRARREYDRARKLADENILSLDLLDGAESAWATSSAACKAAEAQEARFVAAVNVVQVEMAKTVLVAPFDGIVAELSVEVGEWTTPSPPAMPVPAVIDILDPSSIFITAPMDEVDSALITRGLPTRVTVDSHRGMELGGFVGRVAPYVLDFQEQNRTVEVEVVLDDPVFAATLLPGTSADIEVILEARVDVLRIPTGALVEGSRVLINVDDYLEERELEIGVRNWNFTEVLSGLEEGDHLVISLDRLEIADGAHVSATVEEPPAEQAAAQPTRVLSGEVPKEAPEEALEPIEAGSADVEVATRQTSTEPAREESPPAQAVLTEAEITEFETPDPFEPDLPSEDANMDPDLRFISPAADPCLRLRAEPSLDGAVIACVEIGAPVRVLGEPEGSWQNVRGAAGTEGWLAAAMLTTTQSEVQPLRDE